MIQTFADRRYNPHLEFDVGMRRGKRRNFCPFSKYGLLLSSHFSNSDIFFTRTIYINLFAHLLLSYIIVKFSPKIFTKICVRRKKV